MLRLRSSKCINKPQVKIVKTVNGYAWSVLSQDTFKLTAEPLGFHIFAYVWATPVSEMCKSLHRYMDLKGVNNGILHQH